MSEQREEILSAATVVSTIILLGAIMISVTIYHSAKACDVNLTYVLDEHKLEVGK